MVSFDVSGDVPAVVDMPTLWVHNITNTGDTELTTLFWTHSLFDPENPDTFWEPVAVEASA
jgi:UDP-2-acetamido-2,6-beta-L-arabino-hexul-4-ose reductase